MKATTSAVFLSLLSSLGVSKHLDAFGAKHKFVPRNEIEYVTLQARNDKHLHYKRDVVETVQVTVTTYVDIGPVQNKAAQVTKAATTLSASSVSATTTSIYSLSTSTSATSFSSSTLSSTSSASSSSSFLSSSSLGDLSSFSDPTEEFKDNYYECSAGVPTGQGVVSVDWVGLSGWASVMNENGDTAKFCQEGYYCSYACQPGMSKTQWPLDQPSDGQTRGGLKCENGKLKRTNSNTKYLCQWGKDTSKAVSKIDKVVSLCRTDYPGSENMVVPTRLSPGGSEPMSVVDELSYFQWQGKATSAQYYVNDAGVDIDKGCLWGTSAGTVGNWAPVVLGAGYKDGKTWLSIFPNPNNQKEPSYNVKIEAAGNSEINGDCKYEDGKYVGHGSDGCTVAVTKGSANFVFY